MQTISAARTLAWGEETSRVVEARHILIASLQKRKHHAQIASRILLVAGAPQCAGYLQERSLFPPPEEAAVGESEKRAPSSANGAPDSGSQVDGENKTSTPLTNKNDVGV